MIDVTRSHPPPASLDTGRYGDADVRERLHADFMAKCYLCEVPLMIGSTEVDHRHGREPESRICEWSNLFPACRSCNGRRRRPASLPAGHYLDPGGGVETRVIQKVVASGCGPLASRFYAATDGDEPAHNTADELDRLHNDSQPKAADLRSTISGHLNYVWAEVVAYQQARHNGAANLADLRDSVRRLVSRRAPFTMLVRSVVAPFVADLFD